MEKLWCYWEWKSKRDIDFVLILECYEWKKYGGFVVGVVVRIYSECSGNVWWGGVGEDFFIYCDIFWWGYVEKERLICWYWWFGLWCWCGVGVDIVVFVGWVVLFLEWVVVFGIWLIYEV